MRKYIFKRIGLSLITAFLILSGTFIAIKALPFEKPVGDDSAKFSYYENEEALGYVTDLPFETNDLGELLWKYTDTAGQVHCYYRTPIFVQYFSWLGNVVKGEWGLSTTIAPNMNALNIILNRVPVSFRINLITMIIALPLGMLFGIIAALKKNKPTDHFISTAVMIVSSVPSFIMITVFMLVFAYGLKLVPTQWPSDTAPLSIKMAGYLLPVFSSAFGIVAGYTRFIRAELCEVMSSEYLLLARTKGLTKRQAIIRHALKNSMVPVLPGIIGAFLGLLGGSMILESLYGIPGIGSLFISAIKMKDYNVLFVDMAVFTTLGLLFSILVDLSYGFLDPRIRMGAR